MHGETIKVIKNLVCCGTRLLSAFAYVKDTPLVPPNFGGRLLQMCCLCCKGQQIMRK